MSMSIPPISMPPMSIPVLELMAEEAVAVAVELIVMDMSISILVVLELKSWVRGRKKRKRKHQRKVVQTSRRVIVYPCLFKKAIVVLNKRPRSGQVHRRDRPRELKNI